MFNLTGLLGFAAAESFLHVWTVHTPSPELSAELLNVYVYFGFIFQALSKPSTNAVFKNWPLTQARQTFHGVRTSEIPHQEGNIGLA